MAEAAVTCPHCQSEAVVRYGKTSNGKERFRCQQSAQCGRTFLRSYAYLGCLPTVKQQIVEMTLLRTRPPLGLALHPTKTRIAHTLLPEGDKAGFDFLGFEVRQYPVSRYNAKHDFKTLIKPSRTAIKRHYTHLCTIIREHQAARQQNLIEQLHPVIVGWSGSVPIWLLLSFRPHDQIQPGSYIIQ